MSKVTQEPDEMIGTQNAIEQKGLRRADSSQQSMCFQEEEKAVVSPHLEPQV